MFSKLIARNSKRDRRNNGLYFSSMIISIIAFYIILSLPHQDVMLFLKKMESNAVNRLFGIIPIFYVETLVILFFLVYFASSMQMEVRKHEFGVYLTLGMPRKKLFLMLILEDFRNSLIALGIGVPVSIMLSELISLVTAKVVGLGIIGHKFSLSINALFFTIIGFLIVKLTVFIFLSAKIARKDIGDLLADMPSGVKKSLPKIIYLISFIIGLILLGIFYYYGISGKSWESKNTMGITVLFGTVGTILLFFGMRLFIGFLVSCGSRHKLHTYNFRQIQELVINRSTIIAICSLLMFSALCLFGAGIAISTNSTNNEIHILDYTFKDSKLRSDENIDINKIKAKINENGMRSLFSKIIEVKVGYPRGESYISFENLLSSLKESRESKKIDTLINNLKDYNSSYLISLKGYNEIREAANLKPINLKENEACLYIGKDFLSDKNVVNSVLKNHPLINVAGENVKLMGDVQSLPIVTDRAINIFTALVVPDDIFNKLTEGDYSSYVSAVLNSNFVKEKGLMQSISDTNRRLDKISMEYESYIQNIGRQLFFIIAASYITIYLSIILLVVANTIIGVQFLMGQRKSGRRYQTLIHLGATYEVLCKSSSKQINWYFGLPIVVAIINSVFGIISLFTGILPYSERINVVQKFKMALLMVILLTVFEIIYIGIVKKNSNNYLLTLMEPKRED